MKVQQAIFVASMVCMALMGAVSGMAHAEEPWAVTLHTSQSGGCSRSYYHDNTDILVKLNLEDPTAPTLLIEAEGISVIGSHQIGSGSPSRTWSREVKAYEGSLESSDAGGEKAWSFWLTSDETWIFSGGAPSPEQLASTPPHTNSKPSEKKVDLKITCVHDWLALEDGDRVVTLDCRFDYQGQGTEPIRGFHGPDYKPKLYLTQDPKGLVGEEDRMFHDAGESVWKRPFRP